MGVDNRRVRIDVSHVEKQFKVPHERYSSLKSSVINFRKRSFETFKVLDDISFSVREGEFFGILGRNGSGKSTLLKILAGIYTISSGRINVDGQLTPFIELGVGFNPELTGRENVFLNGAILGLTQKEIEDKYDEIVEFAEIERFMDQKLKNFSSGMQVRLAFSIAIQAHNAILLIDEVLAVGDERFQQKCLEIFAKIKQDPNKTVVFVSHDMGTVQRFCDRAIVIHDGKLIYDGDAKGAVYEYKKLNFPEQLHSAEDDEKKDRWGSRAMTIESVKMKETVDSNKDHHIDMTFKLKLNDQGIKDSGITLGIAVYTDQDVHLSGPNSNLVDLRAKDSVVSYRIPNHRLNAGRYKITTALMDRTTNETYDHHEKRYSLAVTQTSEEVGSVIFGGEWSQK